MLQDAAFRRALQWAVDKDKIVAVAYQTHARAAATIIQPDFYPTESDYHWQPPEGDPDTYTFDLERAKQELDAAGYTDGDGNGIREYEGKDITLRLYARTESAESQSCGKLITGWFEEVGLDIDYQVIDDGRLGDLQFAYDGDEYAPDFDLFIWGWGGDIDPNFILSIMTTSSIEAWSDCIWSNEEYDDLFLLAADAGRHPAARRDGAPDAADRVRGIAVHPARLPARAGGLQHRPVGGVGAAERQGPGLVQHPAGHLPRGAQDGGRSDDRHRRLRHDDVDRGRRHRRHRRRSSIVLVLVRRGRRQVEEA